MAEINEKIREAPLEMQDSCHVCTYYATSLNLAKAYRPLV
jgi:hypothetical protein